MAVVWPKKQLTRALVFGIVGGLAGTLLAVSPWGQQAEERFGLGWLFQLRGPAAPPQDVIIVAIDKESSDRLGAEYHATRGPSNWPRDLHARLIDGLRNAGARAVVIDLHFRQPRNEDAALARAMTEADNVVLLEFLEKDQPGEVNRRGKQIPVDLQKRLPPTPSLAAAMTGSGPFTLPKVPDRVSRFWTFDEKAGGVPSLPVVALQLYAAPEYAQLRQRAAAIEPALAARLPRNLMDLATSLGLSEAADALADLLQFGDRVSATAAGVAVRSGVLVSVLDVLRPPPSRYLNFYGPPQTLTTVSYAHALQQLDAGQGAALFAGKAVVLGVSSAVQWQSLDHFRTVYSDPATGLDLSGSEILATAFANLLARNSIQPLGWAATVVCILAWGLAVGLLVRLLKPLAAMVVVAVASAAYLVAAVYLFGAYHAWPPVVIPLVAQAPLMVFIATFLKYREARADFENIRETFGQYLPRSTVNRLVEEGFHPLQDRRTVFGVCLMTDAQGYTAVAEKLPSDQLVDLVNDYMEAIIEPVRRLGGEVSDIKGDSLLAIWASRQDDLAIRTAACRALGAIQQSVNEWNAENPYGVQLPTRIGLHCGSLTLASVGAADHFEQRAVGDIVNTASRLEQLSKELGTRVLVSAKTIEGVDDIVTRYLGRFTLKGRSQPLEVHEYLGWGEEVRQAWSGVPRHLPDA